MIHRGSVLALLAASLASCGSFERTASRYAHAERVAAETVRPGGTLAYRLCRKSASYAYLEERLGLGRNGASARPLAWSAWYATAQAEPASASPGSAAPVWEAYCRELDQTGAVFHATALALRDYADAIESLSDAREFDPTGLDRTASGGATIASSLGASAGVVSASKGVGSAASTFAGVVVGLYREHEVKSFVAKSDRVVQTVLTKLEDYVDALATELALADRRRLAVLRAVDARRDASGAFLPEAELANVEELATDRGEDLAAMHVQLASYARLLKAVGSAHEALAAAAGSCRKDARAKEAIAKLEIELNRLRDARE